MNKQTFLQALRSGLAGLPQADIEERIAFYSEMIDDRMEEGLSEFEAVSAIGPVEAVIAQIRTEIPPQATQAKKRIGALEIVLLVLGAPIWLSLLIAAFAVGVSLYAVLWSVIITLWAGFGSLAACAVGGVLSGVALAVGSGLPGIGLIGAAIICAGLAIFWFYGCKAATNGTVWLTKKLILWIKSCFIKKEAVS